MPSPTMDIDTPPPASTLRPDGLSRDDKIVHCYASAGTRSEDTHCPRCLRPEPHTHRTLGAVKCDANCVLCGKSGHKGKPCPHMSGRRAHLFGKTWLDVHWPGWEHPPPNESIQNLRQMYGDQKSKKQREESRGSSGGYYGGDYQGYSGGPPRGYSRGDYQGYSGGSSRGYSRGNHHSRSGRHYRGHPDDHSRGRSPHQRTPTDDGRGTKRRRMDSEDRPGLADQADVDHVSQPDVFVRQAMMKNKKTEKQAAEAAIPLHEVERLHAQVSDLQEQNDEIHKSELKLSIENSDLLEDLLRIRAERDDLSEQRLSLIAENDQLKQHLSDANAELVLVKDQCTALISTVSGELQDARQVLEERLSNVIGLLSDNKRIGSGSESPRQTQGRGDASTRAQ